MKHLTGVAIAFLLGASIFSVSKYISITKEKRILCDELKKGQVQISSLESDKQSLNQELSQEKDLSQRLAGKNTSLKDNLQACVKKINKLFTKVAVFEDDNKELRLRLATTETENIANQANLENLRLDLAQLTQEKNTLQARLSSIEELKKAIWELKKQKNVPTFAGKPLTEGNRGFIMKDGIPIYPTRVKIEVNPAFPKEWDKEQ